MDRLVARALEARKIAFTMSSWLDELNPGQNAFDDNFEQFSGFGVALCEAPRGALGHWVERTQGKISHYQVITSTCWNVLFTKYLWIIVAANDASLQCSDLIFSESWHWQGAVLPRRFLSSGWNRRRSIGRWSYRLL